MQVIRLLIFSSILFGTITGYNQAPNGNNNRATRYEFELDSASFYSILNRQFTSLVTGQTKNTLGNFASLDIKDAKLTFNGSQIFENGNVFSLTASGAVTDGLFSIFTNSRINTDISLGFQYHFVNPYSGKSINYDGDDVLELKRNAETKKKLFDIRKAAADAKLDSLLWRASIRELEKEIRTLQSVPSGDAALDNAQVLNKRKSIDSLTVLAESYRHDILIRKLNKEGRGIKTDLSQIVPLGFRLDWWTAGYTVSNSAFKTLNPDQPYTEQIKDREYTGHAASLQYNLYNWNHHSFESFYWLAGTSFALSTNQSSLKKREIRDARSFTSGQESRTVTDVYNAYEGIYQKDVKKFRVYTDYYRFLFSGNSAAIHVYPDLLIETNKKPVYNTGVGFVYSFKDSKDDTGKTFMNIELFYNFLDLTDSEDAESNLEERNKVGLRVAFPIKFLN